MLKLKDSVILKKLNADCVYAINCEDPEDYFFKFEGVSKIFIENAVTGIEEKDLIILVSNLFPKTTQEEIKRDLEDFTQTIQGHNLLKT
jgi:hypothetical protein